uniref:C2H2-type domain-containing protein n=1 Tax=Rhabditophanes sp. KR3021 TaxID=114890 RepID=A0AC35U1Z2_9BILA
MTGTCPNMFVEAKMHNPHSIKSDYSKIWSNAMGSESQPNFNLSTSYLESGINGLTIHNLRCFECNVVKTTTEDLEIHIKTNHLQWLPFMCPICETSRASDNQMREHIYSSHKQSTDEIKLFYNDNPEAKKMLQIMMDRSLIVATSGNKSGDIVKNKAKKVTSVNDLLFDKMKANGDFTNTVPPTDQSSEGSFETFLAKLTSNNNNNGMMHENEGGEDKEDITSNPLTGFLDSFLKPQESNVNFINELFSQKMPTLKASHALPPIKILQNDDESSKKQKLLKKRVLGLCSKCCKPVNAGMRQIHIFFHLSKDYNMHRFRCKHVGCTISHYRKDQLESHLLKVHGKVDPDMIDDRSAELHSVCQELSMKLLGTANNNPGPSAAEAQEIYDQQQKDAAKHIPRKKRKLMDDHGDNSDEEMSLSSPDMLVCKLCGKKIMGRVKGFHVLQHLSRDKKIPRYACKLCPYKNDRASNVHTHSKQAHDKENVCEDMIITNSDDMRAMSEACFGQLNDTSMLDLPEINGTLDLSSAFLKNDFKTYQDSNSSHSE